METVRRAGKWLPNGGGLRDIRWNADGPGGKPQKRGTQSVLDTEKFLQVDE